MDEITGRETADIAAERLSCPHDKFALLFHICPAIMGLAELETGIFIDVNQSFQTSLGYTPEEVIGKPVRDVLGLDPEYREHALKKLRTLGWIRNEETVIRSKSGDPLHVLFSAKVFPFQEKTYYLAMAIDITLQKQAEMEKTAAQKVAAENEKLALVGQIAGKMAHDFNNILGIIMGNAQLSLINCTHEPTRKTFQKIYDQTIRGKNLTRNLVAFAKDQELKQEFFSLGEKIDLVVKLLKRDLEEIHVIRDECPGLPEVLADSGMIEHILMNLMLNAVHAVSLSPEPQIIIRTCARSGHVCFEIADNGCGIPAAHLNEIFLPAFTLKGSRDLTGSYRPGIKGSGYGLANVKKYVEQHLGYIHVDTTAGEGTCVVIGLPAVEKRLSETEKSVLTGRESFSGKYILLVEDEGGLSELQYQILTQAPCRHKVDIAPSGQVAIDLFDRNRYDFVSLDYILPGRITGMDVYHHIRRKNDTVPVLFISGNIEFLESVRDLKEKDPRIDHISKPCRNIDYITSIEALLEKAAAGGQPPPA